MMRKAKKMLGLFLTACLICLMTANAFAAESYTYTITLSSGGKGSFSGDKTIELDGISYDASDRINLTSYINQVTVEDGKYYVKGFHLSGQEGLVGSVPKTGDAVYVVSYGVLGNAVSYTVNYQDADGNTLAPSESFYGNVGDKPVIAFTYIEGYQPQAYNLTKTLSSNEAENVFTFVYSMIGIQTVQPAETETTNNNANGTGTEAGTGTGAAGNGTDAAANGAGAANANGDENNADNQDENNADNQVEAPDEETPNAGPDEVIDLDGDEEVPLAGPSASEDDTSATLLTTARIGIGTGVIVVLIGVCYLIVKRTRKRG
jgi:hypothetical protein